MFLHDIEDASLIEVGDEEVKLAGLAEIVAAREEGVDVDTRFSELIQVVGQALFGSELSSVWKMIEHLMVFELRVVESLVVIVPFHPVKVRRRNMILNPQVTFALSCKLEKIIFCVVLENYKIWSIIIDCRSSSLQNL